MKKNISLLILLSYFFFANLAYASNTFGFRNVMLVTSIKSYPGHHKTGEAERVFEGWTEYWEITKDKLFIGDIALKAIRLGAADFLNKPFDRYELIEILKKIDRGNKLKQENER